MYVTKKEKKKQQSTNLKKKGGRREIKRKRKTAFTKRNEVWFLKKKRPSICVSCCVILLTLSHYILYLFLRYVRITLYSLSFMLFDIFCFSYRLRSFLSYHLLVGRLKAHILGKVGRLSRFLTFVSISC